MEEYYGKSVIEMKEDFTDDIKISSSATK